MRVVIARCSVTYSGRLETTLPSAIRALILKDDGSIAVHSDDKAYKPLNWMTRPRYVLLPPLDSVNISNPVDWVFGNAKERLCVTLYDVVSDSQHVLEMESDGLSKVGTEKHLQAWLAQHPERLGAGWAFLAREYPSGAGPVDLLMLDEAGKTCAVEVKRVASLGAVDQVSRYTEALGKDGATVRGVLVAFDVRPRARALAESRGFTWIEVDKEEVLNDLRRGR